MATDDRKEAPEWFSIREAAAYLNVGEPTLYRWMREGKITYRKVGDSTRFLQQDLDSVIEVYPSEKDADSVTDFCPMCHGTELVEGDIRSTGLISFHPARSRFWTLQDSTVPTSARMCSRCGFLLLQGNTEKLAALKPQPDHDKTGKKKEREDTHQ